MSMVDVSSKDVVYREAVAEGVIRLKRETIELIRKGLIEKGDVFTVTTIASIQAVKKTSELLPFCHNIPLTHIGVDYRFLDEERILVRVTVKAYARTGVEMEALVGVATALLNIWDMVKKYEKDEYGQYPGTRIEYIRVVSKVKEKA